MEKRREQGVKPQREGWSRTAGEEAGTIPQRRNKQNCTSPVQAKNVYGKRPKSSVYSRERFCLLLCCGTVPAHASAHRLSVTSDRNGTGASYNQHSKNGCLFLHSTPTRLLESCTQAQARSGTFFRRLCCCSSGTSSGSPCPTRSLCLAPRVFRFYDFDKSL